jgi:hypothetical protein
MSQPKVSSRSSKRVGKWAGGGKLPRLEVNCSKVMVDVGSVLETTFTGVVVGEIFMVVGALFTVVGFDLVVFVVVTIVVVVGEVETFLVVAEKIEVGGAGEGVALGADERMIAGTVLATVGEVVGVEVDEESSFMVAVDAAIVEGGSEEEAATEAAMSRAAIIISETDKIIYFQENTLKFEHEKDARENLVKYKFRDVAAFNFTVITRRNVKLLLMQV